MTPTSAALDLLRTRWPDAGWHLLGALLVTADVQAIVPAPPTLRTDALRWLASDFDRERLGRTAVEAVEALRARGGGA